MSFLHLFTDKSPLYIDDYSLRVESSNRRLKDAKV